MRVFNTAGPCRPDDHYMLPPERRIPGLESLIDRKHYFVVHAPWQSGKTTALRALAQRLSAEGRYAAVWVTAETGAAFADVGAAEKAMLGEWADAAADLPPALRPPPWPSADPGDRIRSALRRWAEHCPRPLVVFVDEIDALRDDVLMSVLRQLRAGHPRRPEHFPWALALIGLRDVRDSRIRGDGRERLGTASPFNIKVESVTLPNFSAAEVAELLSQHTEETGQHFEAGAIEAVHAQTGGQPWLVNALAREVVEQVCMDREERIGADAVARATEVLIRRQDTHLDSLSDRLVDPRVRQVLEPMLAGQTLGPVPRDDQRFVIDLGLVRWADEGGLVVANPIYREVIVRELATGPRASLPQLSPTWLDPEGRLVPAKLIDAFIRFWRQHGRAMQRSAPYHEIAAQLVLMAFLQRVVNGGGSIEREYAIGRGRMDLCLRMGDVTMAIEVKAWREKQRDPRGAGIEQLDRYLAGLGLSEGWLIVFDQRASADHTADVEPAPAERAALLSPGGRRVETVLLA